MRPPPWGRSLTRSVSGAKKNSSSRRVSLALRRGKGFLPGTHQSPHYPGREGADRSNQLAGRVRLQGAAWKVQESQTARSWHYSCGDAGSCISIQPLIIRTAPRGDRAGPGPSGRGITRSYPGSCIRTSENSTSTPGQSHTCSAGDLLRLQGHETNFRAGQLAG